MRRTMLAALAITAAATVVAACSSTTRHPPAPSPTSAANFATWYNGGGNTLITTLTADVHALNTATDLTADRAACETLSRDTTTAIGYGPIPDPQAQISWKTMLDATITAATQCMDAIDHSNSAQMLASSDSLAQAQSASTALQSRLQNLGGAE